ncbi:protease [Paroceanicella profunda]|uniref:Protease n=1 Tax=Paroceanicella profunda TaxID=2579971 RepID=A0A5B8FWQ1_9RHOB|nr:M10 family metallopeptidase [Paroceanicella profunda]QDL90929.1 protease [Paroceanicella profunda]
MASPSQDVSHLSGYFSCHCPGCAEQALDDGGDGATVRDWSADAGDAGSPARDAQQGTADYQVVGLSGNNIDGLLSGLKWAGTQLTFSFPDSADAYSASYSGSPQALDFAAFGTQQSAVVRAILDQYDAVCGLSFVESTGASAGSADMRFALSDDPTTAYAYYPSAAEEGGDVWVHNGVPDWADTDVYAAPQSGNYAYHTFIHEIGHAIGLKHGHSGGAGNSTTMLATWDSMEYSVMTYRSYQNDPLQGGYSNETWGYAQSLMIYDIAALQTMYGADYTTNAGNTHYRFNQATGEMFIDGEGQGMPGANRIFRTVWDGGGRDTYDFSGYSTDLAVDLSPGQYADLDRGGSAQRAYLGDGHYARGHVFNALDIGGDGRGLIENAIGGRGNDQVWGNEAANILNGMAGRDSLFGGAGNDRLIGGSDRDILHGGEGNDGLYGGAGNDDLTGMTGADRLYGGQGRDYITGGDGNDLIIAGDDADRVFGGAGKDRIRGDAGDDVLEGGAERDLLLGGSGEDDIVGGSGDDLVFGGADDDSLSGNDGRDLVAGDEGRDRIDGGADWDRLFGGDGNDIITGGEGRDRMSGDAGNDRLIGGSDGDLLIGGDGADTFVLGTGDGIDLVRDFDPTLDHIDLRVDGATLEDLEITENAGGVILHGLHGTLRLAGVTADDLTPEHFILPEVG